MSSILLIEDQEVLSSNIKAFLELEGFKVSVSHDGEEGLFKALTDTYSLIILDLNLPKKDGLEVCKAIRERENMVPILMLTARSGHENTVKGFHTGADDYLTKPFHLDELLVRVQALLKRTFTEKREVIQIKNMEIDTTIRQVTKDGQKVSLSPKEYALLEFLVRNKGKVKNRTEILEKVWGEHEDLLFSQTVDVHIAYLRKKLGKDLVTTVIDAGYMIE